MKFLIAVPLLMGAAPYLPDEMKTPGAINPAVTQSNLFNTICHPGWTKTIRPPVSYTSRLKRKQLGPGIPSSAYEEDHLVPLELGGAPTDPDNLWPQPWAGTCGAGMKDALEDELSRMVCNGQVTLDTAQRDIATDWVKAYHKYIGPLAC
jgi:hypothetical protein